MRPTALVVVLAAACALLSGCGQPGGRATSTASASAAVSSRASSSTASSAGGSASGAAGSSSAAPAASAPPKPPAARCKAEDPKKIVTLGTRRDRASRMIVTAGRVILTTWNDRTLRGELAAVTVDGSGAEMLADLGGARAAADGLAAQGDAIYFTQDGVLKKVALGGGGVPVVVAEKFGRRVFLHGEHAYGVRFDKDDKRDVATRVALAGGTVEELHGRKREGVQELYYFAAIASDGRHAYLADSGKRTIASIDLGTREVKTLKDGVAFPEGLLLADGDPPAGSDAIARPGEGHLWVLFDAWDTRQRARPGGFVAMTTGYMSPSAEIRVRPASGGDWVEIARVNADVIELAADADCVYLARDEAKQSVLQAIRLPGPAGKP
jgi:hypothetical protein